MKGLLAAITLFVVLVGLEGAALSQGYQAVDPAQAQAYGYYGQPQQAYGQQPYAQQPYAQQSVRPATVRATGVRPEPSICRPGSGRGRVPTAVSAGSICVSVPECPVLF